MKTRAIETPPGELDRLRTEREIAATELTYEPHRTTWYRWSRDGICGVKLKVEFLGTQRRLSLREFRAWRQAVGKALSARQEKPTRGGRHIVAGYRRLPDRASPDKARAANAAAEQDVKAAATA